MSTPKEEQKHTEMDAITIKVMADTMQEIAALTNLPKKDYGDPESLVEAVRDLQIKADVYDDIAEAIRPHIKYYPDKDDGMTASVSASFSRLLGFWLESTGRIETLEDALRDAKGTLSYLATQAKFNHPGFDMVVKQNAENQLKRLKKVIP